MNTPEIVWKKHNSRYEVHTYWAEVYQSYLRVSKDGNLWGYVVTFGKTILKMGNAPTLEEAKTIAEQCFIDHITKPREVK